jgi:predicted dehydrogenase
MARTLKVAVVGTGGISNSHIPGWAASEHAELVAGADINMASLHDWGRRHGVERLVADPSQLFGDPDIDIVDICTPNMYHTDLVVAALEAGKHVICEKPLAPKPDDIQRMIAARDRSGRLLMTAQHFRFMGTSQALKTEVDTGTLGDVYHARSWMLRRAGLSPRVGFTLKKHAGGGPCIDIGVHILDLTLWLMGNPKSAAVSGVSRREIADRKGAFSIWSNERIDCPFDVEDFAAAFVRFENGATLILEVSWFLHHDTLGEDMQMWLYGTEGGAHWPSCKLLNTNYDTQQFYNRHLQMTQDKHEAHAQECIEFARAVAEGGPSPVPAEQSLQVMTILDGLYKSQQTGGEVRLA